jgi:hypothetical protein
MIRALFHVLLLSLALQAAFAGGAPEIYTPSEKKRLESAKTLDDRIRVYDTAFARTLKEIEKNIREDRFENASRTLSAWPALLSESLQDIEKNINPKKKPGRLKRYEIHLRQAIGEMRDLRMYAPIDLYDAIISCEKQAEETRQKFMTFLFNI